MRVIGIDPGSRKTGFGIIELSDSRPVYLASGVIRVESITDFSRRLKIIFQGVQELCTRYQPELAGVEKTFFSKNAHSALKLGEARGVAICAASLSGLPVEEVSPNEVKQSLAGWGHASKDQVQEMVRKILNIEKDLPEDASDALAIALYTLNSLHYKEGERLRRKEIQP